MNKLNFVHLGNGISVYDRSVEINNDHPYVAHINTQRGVSYTKYGIANCTTKMRDEIMEYANYANPTISATQDILVFKTKPKVKYIITGKDRNNKRFVINTTTPWHYNIWNGTIWKLVNGKRKLIKRIYN